MENIENCRGIDAKDLSLVPDLVLPYKFKMPEFDKVKLLESVPLKEKDTEVFSSASEAVIVPANNDPSTTVRELAEVNTGLLSFVSVTVIAIA